MTSIHAGKRQTQYRILQLLQKTETLTRQDIAQQLNLSMPTTLQNTNELLEYGLLKECGAMESTGGRRARKLALDADVALGLGIDIELKHVELVITNLRGKVMVQGELPLPFRDEIAWYQAFQAGLEAFLQEHEVERHRILGAGLSFPGIIDGESETILHSHIFGLEHMSLDRFRSCIPFPLTAANDANCSCYAELTPEQQTYLFVSLNESVGGALMVDGKLFFGDSWQAGEIGHMLLVPHGKTCYCGKHGCADTYLSPKALVQEGQTLEAFFQMVEAGDKAACDSWNTYLDYLAILVTNLRMLCNMNIMLGGAVGAQFRPYVGQLCEKAAKYDLFSRNIDYITVCRRRTHSFATGAAMIAMEQYRSRLLDEQMLMKLRTK